MAACGSSGGGSGSSSITSISVSCSPSDDHIGRYQPVLGDRKRNRQFQFFRNLDSKRGNWQRGDDLIFRFIYRADGRCNLAGDRDGHLRAGLDQDGNGDRYGESRYGLSNVQPLVVDQGPEPQTFVATNQAFVNVTICVPGTNTCQTIDHVEVDTGSSGLRLLSSAVTIPLQQNNDSNGNPLDECLVFLDGYVWGPVASADISMAGELAPNTPIQLIIPSTSTPPVPSTCSGQTTGPDEGDSVQALGANGILGVGLFQLDCGQYCVNNAGPDFYVYYDCPASGCSPTTATLAQQVPTPVINFTADNNGVLIQLESVANGGAGTASGSLIFGIGTQANNALNGATIYAVPDSGSNAGDFTTIYNGTSTPGFVDSGSNGFFFASSIPTCPSPYQDWYCPTTSPDSLSAQNQGTNMSSPVTVNFTLEDATNLFNNGNNFAFSTLGGTYPTSSNGTAFDWGLSFFYGKNIFSAIDGLNTTGGTGPYIAF